MLRHVSVQVAALPSVVTICRGSPVWVCGGLCAGLLYTPRLMYDCLVHWTGAAPAEHFSAIKRPVCVGAGVRRCACVCARASPSTPHEVFSNLVPP
jgi:hypothetical protein